MITVLAFLQRSSPKLWVNLNLPYPITPLYSQSNETQYEFLISTWTIHVELSTVGPHYVASEHWKMLSPNCKIVIFESKTASNMRYKKLQSELSLMR
mmetsp:Transcript_16800/g.20184  ORF Transcript_16800/g.20184 Transcript_16800/m.20184 type:complete len:97 (+) Transcript_16800:875-1165(+)